MDKIATGLAIFGGVIFLVCWIWAINLLDSIVTPILNFIQPYKKPINVIAKIAKLKNPNEWVKIVRLRGLSSIIKEVK